jgi:glycosyltransferase involved in cell wall biosynthesis
LDKLSVIITSNKEDRRRAKDLYSLLLALSLHRPRDIIEPIFVTEIPKIYEWLDICQKRQPLSLYPLKLYLAPKGVGLAGGRNIGIKQSKGNIIAFLDDDVILDEDWATAMINAYQTNDHIGIAGVALPKWSILSDTITWFPPELDWLISCTRWTGWTEPRRVASAWGMNMSFRREAFEKCGLFNEETGYHKGFVAEDIEFSHRVRKMTGKDIWFEPKVIVYHRVYPYRLTPQYIKERSIWIGRTHRMARKLYPEDKLGQNDTDLIKKIVKRMPTMTPKQLKLTLRALFWVGYGYYIKR